MEQVLINDVTKCRRAGRTVIGKLAHLRTQVAHIWEINMLLRLETLEVKRWG